MVTGKRHGSLERYLAPSPIRGVGSSVWSQSTTENAGGKLTPGGSDRQSAFDLRLNVGDYLEQVGVHCEQTSSGQLDVAVWKYDSSTGLATNLANDSTSNTGVLELITLTVNEVVAAGIRLAAKSGAVAIVLSVTAALLFAAGCPEYTPSGSGTRNAPSEPGTRNPEPGTLAPPEADSTPSPSPARTIARYNVVPWPGGTALAATAYSRRLDVTTALAVSTQISWTGTGTGTFSFWASDLVDPDDTDDDDWYAVPDAFSAAAEGAAGTTYCEINTGARFVRVKYVRTAGTITVTESAFLTKG